MHMYICGEWIDNEDRQVIAVTNPATKETIDTVPHANRVDVENALHAAAKAKTGWPVRLSGSGQKF